MPNNLDFLEFNNVKTIEVNPEGWVSPLYIEYASAKEQKIYGSTSYFWRVKGTTHTFVIPTIRMDFLSSGDYKAHFNEILEIFREDYIIWKAEGFTTDWAKEYRQQFQHFILI
jgi:hypothetical protein